MLNRYVGSIAGIPKFREVTPHEKTWLLGQLSHRKPRVRWMAACELGKCQYKESVDALILALHDQNWLVRLHAAQALGRIGDKKAFEPLKDCLQDNSPFVQRRVIVALGRLGDASIIPLILKLLQTNDNFFASSVFSALSHFMLQDDSNALVLAARRSAYLERIRQDKG